jgi:hypothetical protein
MNMDMARRQGLESLGYKIIEQPTLDSYWNTNVFILTPDGRTLADYSNLADIPMLIDNTQIAIDPAAFPNDDLNGWSTAQVNGGAVLHRQELSFNETGLVFPVIGWVVIVIVAALIVTAIFLITNAMHSEPPCGTEPKTVDVSDCAKIIMMPNCDSRLYNACTDTWLEDTWHTWTPPPGWVEWIVIGVIAVAGIYIAAKLLPKIFKRKESDYSAQSNGEQTV